jgi:hypothetical protein
MSTYEHGKIAIDLSGQILADQTEGKSPENGDDDEMIHWNAAEIRPEKGIDDMSGWAGL